MPSYPSPTLTVHILPLHSRSRSHICCLTLAQSKTDEYILEAVSTFEKLPVVIENMLAVEAWRTRVLPSLKPKGLAANNCMRSYFTLYSEGVAVNLLELALYHRHQLAECSETLDLVDYVVRQITGLCVPLAQNEMLKHCKKVSVGGLVNCPVFAPRSPPSHAIPGADRQNSSHLFAAP